MSRLTIVTLPVYCLGCVFTRSTFEKLQNNVFKNQFWRWPSRSPPTVHILIFEVNGRFSDLHIPKKNILLLHISKKKRSRTCVCVCVSYAGPLIIILQFWNISVLLSEFHHHCLMLLLMMHGVCRELQTHNSIYMVQFSCDEWSLKIKKGLQFEMMIWSRDYLCNVRENYLCVFCSFHV